MANKTYAFNYVHSTSLGDLDKCKEAYNKIDYVLEHLNTDDVFDEWQTNIIKSVNENDFVVADFMKITDNLYPLVFVCIFTFCEDANFNLDEKMKFYGYMRVITP